MSASEGPASRTIGGDSRTLGVIGWPVEHSISPVIHNAAFDALGLDWVYVPLPVPPGRVHAAMAGLVALGFAGANVTMPHKTEVSELADELSADARLLRAANTLTVADGAIHGDNTDAPGFDRFLRAETGFDPAGKSALVFGTGGAGRAVTLALARGGASAITVATREPSKALGVVELLKGFDVDVETIAIGAAAGLERDVVVNATPVGSGGTGSLPLPALGPGVVAVDLVYPATTPFLAAAADAGAAAHGGLGLLVHQAALSFERWTGVDAPLDVMALAARAAVSA